MYEILEGFRWVWGRQNPPKTLPKSFQNQDPRTHAMWRRILLDFSDLFYLRFLENMRFASTGAIFLGFSLKSCFCNFHACLVQKTNQNRGRNPKKSMLKNDTFSALILDGFGPRFGKVFGRFFGPKMHENCKNTFLAQTLKIVVFPKEN